MKKEEYYENYPFRVVCSSIILAVLSYVLGAIIFYLINIALGVGYFILCLISLIIGVKFRCTLCYYYGKRCPSGLGRVAKLLFKRGNPDEFRKSRNLVAAAIFSFAALFLPIIAAIILMITRLSWLVLILFIVYIVIAVVSGFGFKRSFCKYCKQGKIGCPAYEGMKGKKLQMDF